VERRARVVGDNLQEREPVERRRAGRLLDQFVPPGTLVGREFLYLDTSSRGHPVSWPVS